MRRAIDSTARDAACRDIQEVHRPSVAQYDTWQDVVHWEDGCDPDGYFLGSCPLADGQHLARFNFNKGIMRCDDGCHESSGRTISLTRALTLLVRHCMAEHNG